MRGILGLRNFFNKKTSVHGGVLVFVSIVVIGVLLFAPEPANAGLGEDFIAWLTEFVFSVILKVITAVLLILAFVLNLVLIMAAWIAKTFMEFFLQMTLTHTYTSGVIFDAGWGVMRDLANMLLVIVFVAIGVGTMLNLQTINKRLLGRFFIVALLINFTPLITGIIIDLSNIAGYVFWDSAKQGGTALINRSAFGGFDYFGDLVEELIGLLGEGTAATTGKLVKAIVSMVMNLFLIFVYLILSILFVGRTIILTMLVIISPLAFIGLIFKR